MPKPKKTTELIPDSRNMNKGNEYGASLINKSFSKFGAGRSILIDKNNKVIAGNKSLDACNAIGLTDLIVVETTGNQVVAVKRTDIDLDTPEGREMALADNATAKENIEWDESSISSIAQEFKIDTEEWGIDLADFAQPQTADDDFEVPEDVKTNIKVGDLFQIGNHRLLCGDATKPESYQVLFGDEQIDLVVTDPPYNVDYTGGTGLKIENDSMPDAQFLAFLSDFHNAIYPIIKPGGAVYMFHADTEGLNFRTAFASSGLLLKQCLVWVKNTLVMGRQDYHWRHEPILYGWKPGAAHYFTKDRTNDTVLECNKPSRNAEHPTMKPIELLTELVVNSSKPGWLVGDSFAGSGSTMVTCEKLNRKCYCMELDPKYCQVIIDRMQILIPNIKVTINGNRYEKPVQTPEEGD